MGKAASLSKGGACELPVSERRGLSADADRRKGSALAADTRVEHLRREAHAHLDGAVDRHVALFRADAGVRAAHRLKERLRDPHTQRRVRAGRLRLHARVNGVCAKQGHGFRRGELSIYHDHAGPLQALVVKSVRICLRSARAPAAQTATTARTSGTTSSTAGAM